MNGRWTDDRARVSGWYSIEQHGGSARGHVSELLGADARVGEIGTIDAMLMTPGAIAAELARINASMAAFHNELLAAAQKRGLVDPTIAVAGLGDWINRALQLVTPGAPQLQQAASILAESQASGPTHGDDPVVKTVLDAAKLRTIPNDPVVTLFVNGWLPIWNAWRTFYASEKDGAWFHNAAYDGEKYLAQLAQIRAKAKALGVELVSADPTDEHAGSGWFQLAKYGLIGAGVLGGMFLIIKARRG